jgi:hypothetical protein
LYGMLSLGRNITLQLLARLALNYLKVSLWKI